MLRLGLLWSQLIFLPEILSVGKGVKLRRNQTGETNPVPLYAPGSAKQAQ